MVCAMSPLGGRRGLTWSETVGYNSLYLAVTSVDHCSCVSHSLYRLITVIQTELFKIIVPLRHFHAEPVLIKISQDKIYYSVWCPPDSIEHTLMSPVESHLFLLPTRFYEMVFIDSPIILYLFASL